MNQIDWKWIAGFFDGEGCLQLQVMKDNDCTIGYCFQPRMEICQGGDKGGEVMRKIMEFFEKEDINYYYRERENKMHELVVQERESIVKWLESIQKLTIQKDEQIDIMLNHIIPELESGKHSTKHGFLILMSMRDELNSLKGSNSNRKYDLEYFENEWDMEIQQNNKIRG